jgi:hypothetical protein
MVATQIFDADDQNFAASEGSLRCFNECRSKELGDSLMKSDYPSPTPFENSDEIAEAPSRFQDEKISDDSGTESNTNSALAPTGLNNPFWN